MFFVTKAVPLTLQYTSAIVYITKPNMLKQFFLKKGDMGIAEDGIARKKGKDPLEIS